MIHVSTKWLPAHLATVLHYATYATIHPPIATANNSAVLATFKVTGGTVGVDSTNAVRRSLQSMTVEPSPITPTAPAVPVNRNSPLFAAGNEVCVFKGVVYTTGATEYVQLGRFLMTAVDDYNDTGSGQVYIVITGTDRSVTISRAKFLTPYTTNPATALNKAVQNLISARVTNIPFVTTPAAGGFPTPTQATFTATSDPWQAAQQLCAGCGYEIFFDNVGNCRLRPIPNPKTQGVAATYKDGTTAIHTSVQATRANTTVPNVIVASAQGSNITPPLQACWWDNTPTSPTFYAATAPPSASQAAIPAGTGTYPTNVIPISSTTAGTQTALNQAAESAFYAAKGLFQVITIKIRTNCAHDAEDVIQIFSTDVELLGTLFSLTTITVPLDGATMEMQGRFVS